jgi:spermidine synthase
MEYDEVARAESERGEVVLRRRHLRDAPDGSPSILELRVNGVFVMDSAENSSEILLARGALGQVDSPRHVLVGGLGLGFTVHEVLADQRVEHVVVAEIEGSLVAWFRDGTISHGRSYLADGRLSLTVADVQQVIAEAARESFDLVLLDVDNGPDFLVHQGNATIYEPALLTQVSEALRPGGAVVVWSSTEAPHLRDALDQVFGNSRLDPCPVVLQGRQETYWLHCARREDRSPDQHRTQPEGSDDD